MGAVRLFLAYVVACGHWSALYARPAGIEFDSWATLGFDAGYAVFFFYAISGFLITYALSTNYGPGEVHKFYANRVIRIFSVYWPVAVIIFLMYPQAWQKFSSANLLDQSTALFLFGLDWNVSFGQPGGQYFGGAISLMHQAWTLGAELTFYLLAPLLMRSWRAAVMLLLASLAVRLGFVIMLGRGLHDTWTYTFFPSALCFFLLGHLTMRASERWQSLKSPLIGAMAIIVVIAAMHFGRRAGFDSPRFWGCMLLFVVGLPSIFEATKNIGWLNWLGNLSYPFYLVHIVVIVEVAPWIQTMPWASGSYGKYIALFLLTLGVVAASALLHLFVEKPISAALRSIRWPVTAWSKWRTLRIRREADAG